MSGLNPLTRSTGIPNTSWLGQTLDSLVNFSQVTSRKFFMESGQPQSPQFLRIEREAHLFNHSCKASPSQTSCMTIHREPCLLQGQPSAGLAKQNYWRVCRHFAARATVTLFSASARFLACCAQRGVVLNCCGDHT